MILLFALNCKSDYEQYCHKMFHHRYCCSLWLILLYFLKVHSFAVFADVVRSAIGFTIFTILLSSWALTFSIGGKQLFGPVWDKLVMYNVADELGSTGWM